MSFASTKLALYWYWSTEDATRCRSAECRAEPVSATAGADGWIPPWSPSGFQGADRVLEQRAEIAKAIGAAVDQASPWTPPRKRLAEKASAEAKAARARLFKEDAEWAPERGRQRMRDATAIVRERLIGGGRCSGERGWCGLAKCPVKAGETKRSPSMCWEGIAHRLKVSVSTARTLEREALDAIGVQLVGRKVVR